MNVNIFFADPTAPTAGSPSTPGTAGGFTTLLIWLVAIFVLFYFMAILPQRRREKQHQRMVASIRRGDVIVTVGGIVGKVIDVRDETLKIKTANVTELEVRKSSVAGILAKRGSSREQEKVEQEEK